jgi:hypothetical protein
MFGRVATTELLVIFIVALSVLVHAEFRNGGSVGNSTRGLKRGFAILKNNPVALGFTHQRADGKMPKAIFSNFRF